MRTIFTLFPPFLLSFPTLTVPPLLPPQIHDLFNDYWNTYITCIYKYKLQSSSTVVCIYMCLGLIIWDWIVLQRVYYGENWFSWLPLIVVVLLPGCQLEVIVLVLFRFCWDFISVVSLSYIYRKQYLAACILGVWFLPFSSRSLLHSLSLHLGVVLSRWVH